ncbi:uncharacterized protein BXZ73DRAFT_97335 [Epithele typhae]|uniref:uncharacterized protein n=1 Tax=Epithele typhae TaxID=378194 RepID=UPI002007C4B5|nr:uncharacterized protein BXZ73DRAFT_97335 [Epithele typhae]KAH9943285.1 hypothetical protein BXZ73DRAFT_97335 [Epithele typhae]
MGGYGAAPTRADERTSLSTGLRLPYLAESPLLILLVCILVLQNLAVVPPFADLGGVSMKEKAELRHQWALEVADHGRAVAQWDRERTAHGVELAQWEWDREAWRKEVQGNRAAEAHRSKEAAEEFERGQEERRARDARERAEEERRRQALREAFQRERAQEEHERRAARDKFNKEWQEEDHRRQAVREAFEQDKEQWAKERKQEEQHRQDVERQRLGVYWSQVRRYEQCTAFGTRTYEAELLDIPGHLDWREVCEDMPIEFHGRRVNRPPHCERNKDGRVWAMWKIDFDEPECTLYWAPLLDLGCTDSDTGTRRYEARLMNLRHGDDWDAMCKTAPAIIHGFQFDHPTVCEDKDGRTGVWQVPDLRCQR